MKSVSSVRCMMALATVVAAGVLGPAIAMAQIYVMESTTADIRVGSALDASATISIPAGGHIRAALPSGKTQTIKGPYVGTVADLTKGQPVNESFLARIKSILKTGGATESTVGATRSISPRPAKPRATFSWSNVSVADGTACVEKGTKLHLVRPASSVAERVTIVDAGTGQQAEAQWEAGSDTTDWPAGLMPRPDATYYVLAPERARRQFSLRVLDPLPAEDDLLAELHRFGCGSQFEAWVRSKLAAK